ncbi:MAG: glycoside hydrolase family 5 protein [Erysipelotrichaceae bacterium]|nr:glycoside hydrolase family 5 protein [Erysipelotrichaceae bacterium]
MKRLLIIMILTLLLCSCGSKTSADGKDRPSVCGKLQVIGTQLCDESGDPVMLRGISTHGLSVSELYINEECFNDISKVMGANVIRLALYTYGMGNVGYCTGGNKDHYLELIDKGVSYAKSSDMYVIIDWHILSDGDPNTYIEEAKEFFETVSSRYRDEKHVLYELCNEPNKVEWPDVKRYAEEIIPIIRNNDPKAIVIVGTPDWSKDVDIAAGDPLEFDNLLYTLHFYSATHRQELRDKAQAAINKGAALFVSEFGITASSGDKPYDKEEADIWISFLEDNGISYVMWNFSKAPEASAAIRRDCAKRSGFVKDDFTEAGQWLLETIAERSR